MLRQFHYHLLNVLVRTHSLFQQLCHIAWRCTTTRQVCRLVQVQSVIYSREVIQLLYSLPTLLHPYASIDLSCNQLLNKLELNLQMVLLHQVVNKYHVRFQLMQVLRHIDHVHRFERLIRSMCWRALHPRLQGCGPTTSLR